jgi:hypothetical protein
MVFFIGVVSGCLWVGSDEAERALPSFAAFADSGALDPVLLMRIKAH